MLHLAVMTQYQRVTDWHMDTHLLPSSRRRPSDDDCLENKTEDYHNCSLLCCVRQCTTICTHIWAVR